MVMRAWQGLNNNIFNIIPEGLFCKDLRPIKTIWGEAAAADYDHASMILRRRGKREIIK